MNVTEIELKTLRKSFTLSILLTFVIQLPFLSASCVLGIRLLSLAVRVVQVPKNTHTE
jgi:hypothetical protein